MTFIIEAIVLLVIIALVIAIARALLPVIIGIALIYGVIQLLGMLPWGSIGSFVLNLIYTIFACFAFAVVGVAIHSSVRNKYGIRLFLYLPILLIVIVMGTLDQTVPWESVVMLLLMGYGLHKNITQRSFVFKTIGVCDDTDEDDQAFFIGMSLSCGSLLLYIFDMPEFYATWAYLFIFGFGLFALFGTEWNKHKGRFDVFRNLLQEKGFLSFLMIVENLQPQKLKNMDEYAERIFMALVRTKEYELIKGKQFALFRADVFQRMVIGIKERNNESGIQKDIREKLQLTLPVNMIEAAVGSMNIEIGQEYTPVNKGFMLMKYEFRGNPVQQADRKVRRAYYYLLREVIEKNTESVEVYPYLWKRLQNRLELSDQDVQEKIEHHQAMKDIQNIGHKLFVWKNANRDYRKLLCLEAFYLLNVRQGHIKYDLLHTWSQSLGLAASEESAIIHFLETSFIPGGDLSVILEEIKGGEIRRAMEYLLQNIEWNRVFINLPHYHAAVCATMSSGKSTFVNALLGYDYIPSSNQACTAKVTSISDNDNLDHIIGCSIDTDGERHYDPDIGQDRLKAWNADAQIDHVILEGNLESVESQQGVLVIHDTPGTNYSGDETHEQHTLNFLRNNDINLLIYLLNGEHISTNDNDVLLSQLKSEIVTPKNVPIVFLVNKLDSFDEENGDDIGRTLQDVRGDLVRKGFEAPIVLPIVANAARLFQMALRHQPFTKKEERDFRDLYERFTEEGFDVTKAEWLGRELPNAKLVHIAAKSITVGGQQYDAHAIETALQRTGIGIVAALLNEKINGGNEA